MLEFVAVALVRLIHQDPAGSMHRSLAPPHMEEQVPLLDMFQAVAVLIYVAGHYRFLGVTRNLFPLDRRRRVRRPDPERPGRVVLGPVLEQKRSPEAVDPQEVGPLILVGAVCACLGQLLWLWVSARSARRDLDGLRYRGININIDRGLWQLAVLLWLFSLLLVVAAGVIAYLGPRRLRADGGGRSPPGEHGAGSQVGSNRGSTAGGRGGRGTTRAERRNGRVVQPRRGRHPHKNHPSWSQGPPFTAEIDIVPESASPPRYNHETHLARGGGLA